MSADIDNTNFYSEAFGVWSALGRAHLIQNKYSNFCTNIPAESGESNIDSSKCVKIGYNIPPVSIGKTNIAGYVFYRPTTDDTNTTNDDNLMSIIIQGQNAQLPITDTTNTAMRKHTITMMGFDTNKTFDNDTLTGVRGGGGAVASNIMRIIDEKIDDGYPLTGSIYGLNGYGNYGHCSNSASNKNLKIYTTDNYTTTQDITDRKKVVYQNKSNQFCIGVIVVDEF